MTRNDNCMHPCLDNCMQQPRCASSSAMDRQPMLLKFVQQCRSTSSCIAMCTLAGFDMHMCACETLQIVHMPDPCLE